MKSVFKHLIPYTWLLVLAIILVIGQIYFELRLPLLMSQIVDQGIAQGEMSLVKSLGFEMIGITIIMFICAFTGIVASTQVASRFGRDLRQSLFAKINTLSYKNIDTLQTGSLITRLTSDVNQLQSSVQMVMRMSVVTLMLMFGAITFSLRLSPQLSVVFLLAVPILLLAIVLLMRIAVPLFGQIQKKTDKITTVLQENFSGIRVVKAYDRADYEEKRFAHVSGEMRSIYIKLYQIMALLQPIMTIVVSGTIVGLVWYGGYLIPQGIVQIGTIMAMITYATMILFSLMMGTFVISQIFQASISVKRIAEVLNMEVDIVAPADGIKEITAGKIVFKDVNFKYQSDDQEMVLKNINLTINPGETVAIMGATGSGKSTLATLIGRYYNLDSGEITIDDIDVNQMDLDFLRENMAYVSQAPTLFSGTIKENILWGKKDATDEEIIQALKNTAAWDFISELKNNIDAPVKQKGSNFSGGQKQRISLARALIRSPKILILDDATSALDLVTEAQVRANIRLLSPQPTTIIIAQRVISAISADRIILLSENGELAGQGTHQELLKNNTLYQEIYNSQLKGNSLALDQIKDKNTSTKSSQKGGKS